MALLETPEKQRGFSAPDFTLKNIDGQMISLSDIRGENGTAIFFICNHCPYVIAIIKRLVATAESLKEQGIGVIAIMSNDTAAYPRDSFSNMKTFARENDFGFPYVIDETQEIARAYGAVCTPDLFGFNKNNQLQYRGRLDSAGQKDADKTTIPELLNAMTAVTQGDHPPEKQFSSMGCSIKWR